jgi:hypothetical protein
MFVMVGGGSNSIATSTDGTSLVGREYVFAGSGLAVAFGNGVWLAGGQDLTNTIVSSADNGVTWTGRGNVISSPRSFAYHGGMWVAGGTDSTNTLAYSADNGVNWTGLGTLVFPSSCNSVTYNASLGLWIAGGGPANSKLAVSPDGLAWSLSVDDPFVGGECMGIASSS